MKRINNSFFYSKLVLCVVLVLSVVLGSIAVSGSDNTDYTFDFEEAASGKYNGSTAWSYDKSSSGFAGNKTSVLKYDPPSRNTYNIAFIMPEAQGGKFALDYDCEYEITFSYYSGGLGSGVIDDFMIRDSKTVLGSTTLEIDKKNGTDGRWKKATITFQPQNENEYMYLGLKVTGQYSKVLIYFDDFVVSAKKFDQGPADETFINTADDIINFDGENKAFSSAGLKYVSGVKRYVVGNSTTMLKFTAAAAGTDYGIAFYDGMETVPMKSGKYYTVKFKYYNPSEEGTVSLTVGTSAKGSAWTDYQIGDIVTLSNNTVGWVNGEASFVVTPKTEEANHLFIRVKSDVMGNETYFDNFAVIQQPDMDIDIVEMDLQDKNATLTSAAWDWVDASDSPIAGNSSTLMKFEPGDKALTYYVTKLYKGKRTVPIDNGASYSLSFDYYADAYEGTLGEFYIKNGAGKNLFYSYLDTTPEKGTGGEWKRANFVFTATAEEDDLLQIMCYTKADNTKVKVYFDNFKLVRLDNIIANQKLLEAQNSKFDVTVSGKSGSFEGYADISLQFKLNFDSVYGNKKVITIAGDKYFVSDYGMVYRPNKFSALGPLAYSESALKEELISLGYHTKVIKTNAKSMQFTSDIINIRKLYKDMDIDARPFIVISPANGTGTIYAYSAPVTLNVLSVAATSKDNAVKQFIS